MLPRVTQGPARDISALAVVSVVPIQGANWNANSFAVKLFFILSQAPLPLTSCTRICQNLPPNAWQSQQPRRLCQAPTAGKGEEAARYFMPDKAPFHSSHLSYTYHRMHTYSDSFHPCSWTVPSPQTEHQISALEQALAKQKNELQVASRHAEELQRKVLTRVSPRNPVTHLVKRPLGS